MFETIAMWVSLTFLGAVALLFALLGALCLFEVARLAVGPLRRTWSGPGWVLFFLVPLGTVFAWYALLAILT